MSDFQTLQNLVKVHIGTSTPKNAAKARQQALAIAFSMKRKKRR